MLSRCPCMQDNSTAFTAGYSSSQLQNVAYDNSGGSDAHTPTPMPWRFLRHGQLTGLTPLAWMPYLATIHSLYFAAEKWL